MLSLIPVSMPTTCGPPSPSKRIGSAGGAVRARSAPSIEGSTATRSRASLSPVPAGGKPPPPPPPGRGGGGAARAALARLALRRAGGEDATAHRAAVADVADARAGVDSTDRRHAAIGEPVEPASLRRGDVLTVLGIAHDHAASVGPIGLHRR